MKRLGLFWAWWPGNFFHSPRPNVSYLRQLGTAKTKPWKQKRKKPVAESAILQFIVNTDRNLTWIPNAANRGPSWEEAESRRKWKLPPSNRIVGKQKKMCLMYLVLPLAKALRVLQLYINDKFTSVIKDPGTSCNLMSENVFQSLSYEGEPL